MTPMLIRAKVFYFQGALKGLIRVSCKNSVFLRKAPQFQKSRPRPINENYFFLTSMSRDEECCKPRSIRPLSAELSLKSLGMVSIDFRFLVGPTKPAGSPAVGKLQEWSTPILKATYRGYETHHSTSPSAPYCSTTGRMFEARANFRCAVGVTKN